MRKEPENLSPKEGEHPRWCYEVIEGIAADSRISEAEAIDWANALYDAGYKASRLQRSLPLIVTDLLDNGGSLAKVAQKYLTMPDYDPRVGGHFAMLSISVDKPHE
jgi:hypothetical protein